MVFWTLTILFVVRALLRDEPRWWLWAGLVVGVSLWNKQLIVLLLLGLLVGLLIAGPRACVPAVATLGRHRHRGADRRADLIWQATNHWPELTMAKAISQDKGGDDRTLFIPFQIILLGAMVYVWIRGLIAMFRRAGVAAGTGAGLGVSGGGGDRAGHRWPDLLHLRAARALPGGGRSGAVPARSAARLLAGGARQC